MVQGRTHTGAASPPASSAPGNQGEQGCAPLRCEQNIWGTSSALEKGASACKSFLQLQQQEEGAQLCWLELGSERTLQIEEMGWCLPRERSLSLSRGEGRTGPSVAPHSA